MNAILRFYMVPTCTLSKIYEMEFHALALRVGCDFVPIDIDTNAIDAVKYIRAYGDRVSKIPFYTVHAAPDQDALLAGNAVTTNLEELEETLRAMNK